MKTMKKTIQLLLSSLVCFYTTLCSALPEADYNVELYWIRGPLRMNPTWTAWSATSVEDLRKGNVADLGYRLRTEYVTQPPERNAHTLWLMAKVTGKNGVKINVDMLRFSEKSSDRGDMPDEGNTLKSTYSLVDKGFDYSPQTIGIIWGAEDQIIRSGSGSVLVDALYFIGMQSPYYPYTTEEQLDGINSYILSQDMKVTGTLEIVKNGIVVASASRTLYPRGEPANTMLRVEKSTDAMDALIFFEGIQDHSAIIQSREFSSVSWTT